MYQEDLNKLSKQHINTFRDPTDKFYPGQRLNIAIKRGNITSPLGTLVVDSDDEEYFVQIIVHSDKNLNFSRRKWPGDGRRCPAGVARVGSPGRFSHAPVPAPGATTIAIQSRVLTDRDEVTPVCTGEGPAFYQLYLPRRED